MNDNKRIIYNTGYTYIRLLITLSLSLFSTKYVLQALGEVDYGIYNLIAGIVVLFSFISTTMATTTQRFISFSIGKYNDISTVREIIYSSVVLHFLIAIVAISLVQVGGLWAINNILSIPPLKIYVAKFVLITVSCGLLATILSVPFEAALMAKENILFVSIVSTIITILKFGFAVLLLYIDSNRLELYAILIASLSFFKLGLQWWYCNRKFEEARFTLHRVSDYKVFKHMGVFAGWVIVGTTCSTIRQQGSSILLNTFFGVIINAATGIATQVYGVLMQFTSSIVTAIRPQLVKSAGANNVNRMKTLTYMVCKYPLLLTGLTAIPLIITMSYVLPLWLKEVPPYTSLFCQMLLLSAIINQSTIGLTIALEAYGKVKKVHMLVGGIFLLVIPIGYVLLKLSYPPQSVYVCIVASEVGASIIRLKLTKTQLKLGYRNFLNRVLIPSLYVLFPITIIDILIWKFLTPCFTSLLLIIISTIIFSPVLIFKFGLTAYEKDKMMNKMKSIPLLGRVFKN